VKEKKILAAILANQKQLDGCAGHEFKEIVKNPSAIALWGLVVFLKCTHCAGELDATAVEWYERGQEHAKRRPRSSRR